MGLLAWADEIGARECLRRMEELLSMYGEDRYRPSPLLRQTALTNSRFTQQGTPAGVGG